MRALVLLFFALIPASAQVVINEVHFRTIPSAANPLQAHQWVELYNKGTDPVDLAG